jgi:hypothetical protein
VEIKPYAFKLLLNGDYFAIISLQMLITVWVEEKVGQIQTRLALSLML